MNIHHISGGCSCFSIQCHASRFFAMPILSFPITTLYLGYKNPICPLVRMDIVRFLFLPFTSLLYASTRCNTCQFFAIRWMINPQWILFVINTHYAFLCSSLLVTFYAWHGTSLPCFVKSAIPTIFQIGITHYCALPFAAIQMLCQSVLFSAM